MSQCWTWRFNLTLSIFFGLLFFLVLSTFVTAMQLRLFDKVLWQLSPPFSSLVKTALRGDLSDRTICLASLGSGAYGDGGNTVDVLIFSKDRPLRLLALLESQAQLVRNVGTVAVIFAASRSEHMAGYALVAALFPHVHFVRDSDFLVTASVNIKSQFQTAVEFALRDLLHSRYISPIVDEMIWLRETDMAFVAAVLTSSNPEGDGTFQMRLGWSVNGMAAARPESVSMTASKEASTLHQKIFCYRWTGHNMAPPDAAYTTIVDAAVYDATRLRAEWATLRYNHPGDLEGGWYAFKPHYGKGCVHFFFQEAAITNVEIGMADKVRNDHSKRDADSVGRIVTASLDLLSGQHLNVAPAMGLLPDSGHVLLHLDLVLFEQCRRWGGVM